jgi:hypothetical protein
MSPAFIRSNKFVFSKFLCVIHEVTISVLLFRWIVMMIIIAVLLFSRLWLGWLTSPFFGWFSHLRRWLLDCTLTDWRSSFWMRSYTLRDVWLIIMIVDAESLLKVLGVCEEWILWWFVVVSPFSSRRMFVLNVKCIRLVKLTRLVLWCSYL